MLTRLPARMAFAGACVEVRLCHRSLVAARNYTRSSRCPCLYPRLRQVDSEFVNFAGAGFLNKEYRAVRRAARPRSKWPKVSLDACLEKYLFVVILSDLGTAVSAFSAHEIIEVDRFAIGGPYRVVYRSRLQGLPLRPLFCLSVIQLQLGEVSGDSRNVAAVWRYPWTEKAL